MTKEYLTGELFKERERRVVLYEELEALPEDAVNERRALLNQFQVCERRIESLSQEIERLLDDDDAIGWAKVFF